jgi:hypothetical protein
MFADRARSAPWSARVVPDMVKARMGSVRGVRAIQLRPERPDVRVRWLRLARLPDRPLAAGARNRTPRRARAGPPPPPRRRHHHRPVRPRQPPTPHPRPPTRSRSARPRLDPRPTLRTPRHPRKLQTSRQRLPAPTPHPSSSTNFGNADLGRAVLGDVAGAAPARITPGGAAPVPTGPGRTTPAGITPVPTDPGTDPPSDPAVGSGTDPAADPAAGGSAAGPGQVGAGGAAAGHGPT